jgi:hypothetical protein
MSSMERRASAGIGPVVPRIEEGAERADLVAQREYPVRDALRGSGNHETLNAPPG